jgi:hypothetical protein
MPQRFKALLLAATLILGLLVGVAPASATTSLKEGDDPAAVLFDPLKPISVEVMSALGGPPLTRKYLDSDTYRRATIKITLSGTNRYVIIRDVGVRQKGSHTRRFQKMSLKIKFDVFVQKQEFLGLKRLTLNAMVQDRSQVHEVTSYKLFREAGIPAPRAGYARVKIDGAYQGLYANIESLDEIMLSRWFTSTEHLYSGPRPCDLVPGNDCYSTSIGDTERTDLFEASRLHLLSGKEWWTQFKKRAHADQVIKFMATEIYLGHWDGYSNYMRNNHYVHFDKDGKFTLLPWGTDQTFPVAIKHQTTWDGSQPVHLGDATEMSTLFVHCIDYKPCHERLLYFGYKVSKIAQRIDLAGYKDLVVAKISQPKYAKNDVAPVDSKTEAVAQSWVSDFLPISRKGLLNYLSLHSPTRIEAKVPKDIRIGLTAKPELQSVWEPGVSVNYQWFLDNEPIENAMRRYLPLKDEYLGKKIKLRLTLKKSGVAETEYFTNSQKVLPKLFRLSPVPTVTGTSKVGQTLTAEPSRWDSGVKQKFQWLRDGEPIEGATDLSYKLTNADKGKLITFRVTSTKELFAKTSRTSLPSGKVR